MRITPIDDQKTTSGAWTEYMGVPVLVARSNNDVFRREFRRLSKPYQRQIDQNRLPEDIAENILATSMAKGILLDWDSEKFPGNVKYSFEAAKEVLTDDPDFRDFVTEYSGQAENYYEEEKEYSSGK